ncbi:MAG: restriction endonuclease [Deltaproteobacteria bacterium]|nr:restriction endonuclease [Deltaproteobacteria bacterium]
MSMPDFQMIFRPLLELASDGKEHSLSEAYEYIADHFKMTDEERTEMLPSGRQKMINNRVGWSRTYLAKALLMESPKRGVFVITQRGRDFLKEVSGDFKVKDLYRFDDFRRFHSYNQDGKAESSNAQPEEEDVVSSTTPEEDLESAYQSLHDSLSSDLLDQVLGCTPAFFEQLVVDLLVKMGYGGSRKEAGKATKISADGGIDGIINEDRLGLDSIYIQAKRWKDNVVGRPEIQKFAGALQGFRAKKGVFITTSSFSSEAWEYTRMIDSRIVLIDGQRLTELMIEHDVGVAQVITYSVKRIDADYFEES